MIFAIAALLAVLSVAIGVFACRVTCHILSMDEELINIATVGSAVASAAGTLLYSLGSGGLSSPVHTAASLGQYFMSGFPAALSAALGSVIGVAAIVLAVRGAKWVSALLDEQMRSRTGQGNGIMGRRLMNLLLLAAAVAAVLVVLPFFLGIGAAGITVFSVAAVFLGALVGFTA